MNDIDYVLPSGLEVTMSGVPEGASSAMIKEELIRQGRATAEDFVTSAPAEPAEEASWIEQNMELPMGLGGALAGAAVGTAILPVVGTAVGGILGGMAGSFGGSLVSNELQGEELDYADAVQEAAISLGFDVATLGLGKVLKPAFIGAKKALGYSPKEVAEELVAQASKEGTVTGSRESLQASQAILQEKGASLTKYQTGQASAIDVFAEKIANMGMLSSGEVASNATKANAATQSALTDIVNKVEFGVGNAPADMGEAMYDILNVGKKALSKTYGAGIDELTASLSKKMVNTTPVKAALEKFLKDNSVKATGKKGSVASKIIMPDGSPAAMFDTSGKSVQISTLDPSTVAFIERQMKEMLEYSTIPAEALLKFDKKMAGEIREIGEFGSTVYNTTQSRQLGQMQEAVQDAFLASLRKADPEAAVSYAGLKKAYAEGMGGLLPEINKGFVNKAGKGDFDSLGNLLVTSANTSRTVAFMKSIDEAYAQIGKGNTGGLAFKSAGEAKQAVKQAYLNKLMPELGSPNFSIAEYADLAKKFSKPSQASKLKAITGDDYGRVKQLFNLMAEASRKPDSSLGSLLLRGKEYAAIGTVGALATGAVAGIGGGLVTGAAVLATPFILAKMASRPKSVSKLLAFQKTTFKSEALKEKAALFIVSDLMQSLSTREQEEVRASLAQ